MAGSKRNVAMNWQVYIILCSDDSLYTGITTDVERRFAQHLAGTGAKYFRGRSPHRLVYLEVDHDRSSASRREVEIKRLRPDDKRLLIASPGNRLEETSSGTDQVD
jgi:putative endonuclease